MPDRARCPYCGALNDVRGAPLKRNGGSSVHIARCEQCNRAWTVRDGQERRSGPSERRRVPRRLRDDCDLISTARVSVLLIGENSRTSSVVGAVRAQLGQPLITLHCDQTLELPTVSLGTVILSGVEALALEDQHRLMAWLERGDRPRVISTSRVSLLPIVQAGMFIESLYYRLNTLCIDLTG